MSGYCANCGERISRRWGVWLHDWSDLPGCDLVAKPQIRLERLA